MWLPQRPGLPTTAAVKLFFMRWDVLFLFPLCGSLGSVSDGPAQWKTLLNLTWTHVLETAPPTAMTVPCRGKLLLRKAVH